MSVVGFGGEHIDRKPYAQNIASLTPNDVPPSIIQHYKTLSAHGSNCITCGNCEARCPFNVAVNENMKKAADIFGV